MITVRSALTLEYKHYYLTLKNRVDYETLTDWMKT